MKNFTKYFKIWLILTNTTAQIALISRFSAFIFILAKFLRFSFFILFIFIVISKTKTIAGYNFWQVIVFYATFNLLDTMTQFFLREVYRFRAYVLRGFFDYILVKPISPLFRSLFGGSDILDLPMLVLSFMLIVFAVTNTDSYSLEKILLYAFLIANGFIIALGFHILVLALGVITTEVDNSIMLYRDLTTMGRLPVDVYKEPIRGIVTFVIPIGIMMTFPVKALLGLLSVVPIIISFLIGVIFLFLSFKLWRFSLKHYSSISS